MSDQNNPQVVLWYRSSNRHKWREVARAMTGPAVLAMMDKLGLKGGSWMRLEAGKDPNTKARAKA